MLSSAFVSGRTLSVFSSSSKLKLSISWILVCCLSLFVAVSHSTFVFCESCEVNDGGWIICEWFRTGTLLRAALLSLFPLGARCSQSWGALVKWAACFGSMGCSLENWMLCSWMLAAPLCSSTARRGAFPSARMGPWICGWMEAGRGFSKTKTDLLGSWEGLKLVTRRPVG